MTSVLRTLRQATRSGRGALVPVVGEPGIGKTSLLLEAAEQARRQGFAIGVGKTEEVDQVAPGAPLLIALRSGEYPLLDTADFASLAPLRDQPLWLIDRVAELLAGLAARRPVLIGLDDVQWADPITRLALRLLPSRLAPRPVVWVLTSRLTPSGHLDEVLAAADPAVPVSHIALGPITGDDIDALAADRLGSDPDAATRSLLRGLGGSPFWAVQLLTGLSRRRARGLPDTGAHAELIAGIRQRMAVLPPFVTSVVRVAAVCGRAIQPGVVAGLLDDTAPELVYEAALHAQDEGLLTLDEDGLSLPHDLIREAVYADIPADERRRMHRTRARQLVAGGAGALVAVRHFLASSRPGDLEASQMILQAAAESATLMPEQAATLALRAFTLVRDDAAQALPIGQQALSILVRAQRNSDVIDLADTLLPLATEPATLARIEISAGQALWETSAGPELEHRATAALARPDIPPVERARLAALRSLAMTRTPGAPHSAAAAVAALAEGARLADPPTRQIALLALTEATRNVGEHQKVLDYFDQLRDISPDAYIAERIRALQHLDRYADAEALLAKIRKEAGDNLDRLLPSYLFAQAWQHHNLGEIDAAEAVARTLLRQAEATGNFAFVLNSRMILCGLDIYRGELADARDHLAPLRDAAERNDPIRTSRLLAVQAWLAAEQGDLRESMDIAAPLLAVADNGCYAWAWSPAWMRTFAGAAHRAGDLVTAERAAHIAMLGARRNPGIASMEGVSWQVRGYLDRDIAVLRQAVATLRRSPRRLLLADALRDLGDAQAAAGQDDGGHAALGEAYALYRETGATGRARSVGEQHPEIDLPRRARPRNQARALHGWDALTESEARVAELIIAGHTNRSAASVLGVSANTISTHLRSVFAKFNVRSRVQLANAIRDAASGPSDRDEPVPR